MRKILYIWKDKYPWDVRVEKFCNSLIENGFNVLLLCRWSGEEKETEIIDGITLVRVGYKKKSWISSPLSINPYWKHAITNQVNLFKPDLIITREFFLTSIAKKYAHDIPVIMDMAEHYPEAMKGWKKYSVNPILKFLVHYAELPLFLEKRAIQSSDGVVVVSDELKKRLINEFNYDADKIAVVHNTPQLNMFDKDKKGVSFPPVKFAYHGYLSHDRNIDILILAFIKAMKVNSQIRLFIAGDGEPFSQLRKLIDDNNANDRITLHGSYSQSELADMIAETDVAILPYKTNTFINHIISNKLFDYMATGKPVIVSEAKPMIRIIEETQCGIVADCSSIDELSSKILDAASTNLNTFSENGMKWAETKYNWDIDFSVLLNFIKGFLK